MTDHDVTEASCRTCGACCSVGYHVGVGSEERSRVHGAVAALRPGVPVEAWYRFGEDVVPVRDGRCVALAGVVGESVSCRIYEERPKVCSNYPPGSPACLETRAVWFGDLKTPGVGPTLLRFALVSIRIARPERATLIEETIDRYYENDFPNVGKPEEEQTR